MASKRKVEQASKQAKRSGNGSEAESGSDAESTSSSYAPSAIDVDFDFVAPTEIDFQALKRLVQQLYYTHAPDLDLGALAEHIIKLGSAESNALGTVVKVEGDEDADPFAFASVLDLSSGQDSPAAKTLREYYGKMFKSGVSGSTAQQIGTAIQSGNVLQVFHERMINMPPQIMPPLYRMLFDEIQANDAFKSATHLLFFSRVFTMQALEEDDEQGESAESSILQGRASTGKAKSKRSKKTAPPTNAAITTAKATDIDDKAAHTSEYGLFHPEDTIIAKYAEQTHTFRFPAVKDSDESFNAPMFARVALVPRNAETIKNLLLDLEEGLAVTMGDA